MHSERGLDRLVFFTDAVTAIAITLLILPLVDSVAGSRVNSVTPERFLAGNVGQLGTFVLSFAVIARLWIAHHALFEHVKSYTPRLMAINLFWAFTIVLLPLPTAIVTQFTSDRVSIAFYIGTMTLSSVALSLMGSMIRRNPSLQSKQNPLTDARYRAGLISTGEFTLALVIAVVFPILTFYPLLILLASALVGWALQRRSIRHAE